MQSELGNTPETPLFVVHFPDNTVFELPKNQEPVFVDYFGPNPNKYPAVAERLCFLVGKYVDHQTWPSKFDGIDETDESINFYDDPNFYFYKSLEEVPWYDADWKDMEDGQDEESNRSKRPTMAQIAEQIIYVTCRPGFMEQMRLNNVDITDVNNLPAQIIYGGHSVILHHLRGE